MRTRILWLSAAIVLLISCGEDDGTNPPTGDLTPPATIGDLTITDSLGTALTITWTAVGDDDTAGTAAEYDIRYATAPITPETWDDALELPDSPAPATAGEAETVTIGELTWWTRYYVGIRTADEADNWAGISNVAAGTAYPDPSTQFLIQTRDGVVKMDINGVGEVFLENTREVEVFADRIYCGGSSITEYDLAGTLLRAIPLPAGTGAWYFAALPNARFLLMENSSDTVCIVDDVGNMLAVTALLPEPGSDLQNLDAVVAGNNVIVSEDGQNHLLRIDLSTYELSVFKDLTALPGWLGAIDYRDGVYFICQSQDIYEFTVGVEPTLIGSIPAEEFNITGAVAAGGHVFVVVNFAGKMYRVNRSTGEVVVFAEGLNYPQDVELLPVP